MYDYFVQSSCSLLDTGVIGGLFRYSYILVGTEVVVWSDVVVYLGYSGDGNFDSLFYIVQLCLFMEFGSASAFDSSSASTIVGSLSGSSRFRERLSVTSTPLNGRNYAI